MALIVALTACTSSWNAPLPQTWSNRAGLTVTPIATGMWAAERKRLRFGLFDVGSRSIFSRTSSGALVVHAAAALDDGMKAGIKQLGGGVTCIIGSGAAEADKSWVEAYPNAQFYPDAQSAVIPYKKADAVPAFEVLAIAGDKELERKFALGDSEPVEGRLSLSSLVIKPEPFTLFFHSRSKTLLCGQAWWNFPRSKRPSFEDDEGAAGTGAVHDCPKVPVEGSSLPDARVSKRTRMWAGLKNGLFWPIRRSRLSQGLIYREQVEEVLAWDIEQICPAHGDVLRGQAACKAALKEHFLPQSRRAGNDEPPVEIEPTGYDRLKDFFDNFYKQKDEEKAAAAAGGAK